MRDIVLHCASGIDPITITTASGSDARLQDRRWDGIVLGELLYTHFPSQAANFAVLDFFRRKYIAAWPDRSLADLRKALRAGFTEFLRENDDEFRVLLAMTQGEQR